MVCTTLNTESKVYPSPKPCHIVSIWAILLFLNWHEIVTQCSIGLRRYMGLWEQSWCIPHNRDVDVVPYNCDVVFSKVHS